MGITVKPDLQTPDRDDFMDLPFIPLKLNYAIKQTKVKSSLGLDNIDYKVRSFSSLGSYLFLRIYNDILEKGQFPIK